LTVKIGLEVSPKTIDIKGCSGDVRVLRDGPSSGESRSDNVMNRVFAIFVEYRKLQKIGNWGEDKILLSFVEGAPVLLTLGALPYVKAIE
jgi:hypothetical protein